MSTSSSACASVGSGSVGESGATSLLHHTVKGPTRKIMVLRRTESSLCPNTGAIATLSVNGIPVASGNLTGTGGLIQAEASPGDQVCAVIHTIPLFNNVLCIRLGNLSFQLDECELVGLNALDRTGGTVSGAAPATKDWYAWNDLMPPKPDVFHVKGEVQVSNLGMQAVLTPRIPQGFNTRILSLDLNVAQRPGNWCKKDLWIPVNYEKVNITYDSVEVFYGDQIIATFPADNIQ